MTCRTRIPPLLGVVAALLLQLASGPSATAAGNDVKSDPLITVQLLDADIRDALRLISRQANVDVVVSNNVAGTVTVDLEEASLMEALDAIMTVGDYSYSVDGRIVTVRTLEEMIERKKRQEELRFQPAREPILPPLETLYIKLHHVDAERIEPVVEKLLSERGSVALLKTADHVAQDRGTTVSSSQSSGSSNSSDDEDSDLQIGTQLATTSQGQPAKSHTLVVLDEPTRLTNIRHVVDQIDVKPAQILIEARFVEIRLGDDEQMGIDWNVVVKAAGAAAPNTFPFGTTSLGSFNPYVDSPNAGGGIFPSAPGSVSTPGQPGLFTFGTLDFTQFTAVLALIENDARSELVSNPRVLVRDRNTATILVGERYPILSTNITDFGTVTEELDRYEPIGVQLEVTPSVLDDDEVELLVRPSTSVIGGLVEGSTGLQVVRINTRQIDTSITAKDSQTIVLGGLVNSIEMETESSVPFLGDLPLLGWLFRSTSKESEKVDLVVFLTVTIMKDHGLSDMERAMLQRSSIAGEAFRGATAPRSELQFNASPPKY